MNIRAGSASALLGIGAGSASDLLELAKNRTCTSEATIADAFRHFGVSPKNRALALPALIPRCHS